MTRAPWNKTWFTIEGALEPIDYDGPAYFRFPLELADIVVEQFSAPGDWILDPFCGFGTTLVAAQRLGRNAIGFEKDADRGQFAAARAVPPSRVIVDDIRRLDTYALRRFDLVFTSPPYRSLGDQPVQEPADYCSDLRRIFESVAHVLRPRARVVLEMSNVRDAHSVRTVAWDAARVLSEVFTFDGELIRCNSGPESAGPGFDHSYLLTFTSS